MDNLNAFIGKTSEPKPAELEAALGSTFELWKQVVDSLTSEPLNLSSGWNYLKPKYGWFIIIAAKKRRIVYLSPFSGCFQASFILGDRAMAAAREAKLSKSIQKILDEAPHYPEGTGVRIVVKSAKDLPAIRKLARIKLDN
jgi:hypothetical protein